MSSLQSGIHKVPATTSRKQLANFYGCCQTDQANWPIIILLRQFQYFMNLIASIIIFKSSKVDMYIDYFIESATHGFLFTSYKTSEFSKVNKNLYKALSML